MRTYNRIDRRAGVARCAAAACTFAVLGCIAHSPSAQAAIMVGFSESGGGTIQNSFSMAPGGSLTIDLLAIGDGELVTGFTFEAVIDTDPTPSPMFTGVDGSIAQAPFNSPLLPSGGPVGGPPSDAASLIWFLGFSEATPPVAVPGALTVLGSFDISAAGVDPGTWNLTFGDKFFDDDDKFTPGQIVAGFDGATLTVVPEPTHIALAIFGGMMGVTGGLRWWRNRRRA